MISQQTMNFVFSFVQVMAAGFIFAMGLAVLAVIVMFVLDVTQTRTRTGRKRLQDARILNKC